MLNVGHTSNSDIYMLNVSPNLGPVSAILGHTLNYVSRNQLSLNTVRQNAQSNFLPKLQKGAFNLKVFG